MEIANCTLVISPEHKQKVYDLTPADALILFQLHSKEAKGQPLFDITITGEAMTETKAAQPAQPAEYDADHRLLKSPTKGTPAEYRKRTQAEEIQLLQKFYTGNIDGKPAFKALFPGPVIQLPETFEQIAGAIGNPPIADARVKVEPTPEPKRELLRNDGPTIEQFMDAGYSPDKYPPFGYAAKSTPEEVAFAIANYKPANWVAPTEPTQPETIQEAAVALLEATAEAVTPATPAPKAHKAHKAHKSGK